MTSDRRETIPLADGHRNPRAARRCTSIIVQERTEAAILGEQRVAAIAEQVQVEGLVRLLLAVAVHDDRDSLRGLAGGEGQRAGLGDIVAVARLGGAGPVTGLLGGKASPAAFVQ